MFALLVDVAPAPIGEFWMALLFHMLVTWNPAIHAGMTVMMLLMPLPAQFI